jgi:hypothetical protein
LISWSSAATLIGWPRSSIAVQCANITDFACSWSTSICRSNRCGSATSSPAICATIAPRAAWSAALRASLGPWFSCRM